MALGQFLSNQGTQTGIIVDTIGGSVMAVQKIDISPYGSEGTVWNGNVGVSSGTINILAGGTLGILTNGTLSSSGTTTGVGSVSSLGSLGMLTAGTISTLNNGTINLLPLPGSVLTTAVVIGTTAGTAAIPTTALTSRKTLIAYNVGTSIVYIGGTGVTLANGIPIAVNAYTPGFDLGTGVLYAIAATPGGTVISLEIS